MKYNKVRKSHLATAKLITIAVDLDTIADYYPSEALPNDFIPLCKMILTSAKCDVSHEFDIKLNRPDAYGVEEWLRGLPSVCSIPFSNWDIELWLTDNDIIMSHHSQARREKLVQRYWHYIAQIICMYANK